jgi:hypothetical protein
MNARAAVLALTVVLSARAAFGLGATPYVSGEPVAGGFAVAGAAVYVDADDHWGVARAAGDLRDDIERVTGSKPALVHEPAARAILIGTLGHSRAIDRLAREGRIDAARIAGKWESFLIQVLPDALVIAGSDKRGTVYGIYDLSERIGVSPWVWWADVPVRHSKALYVRPGTYIEGPPAVKYRGIFLNDEEPSLSGWAKEKYGSYNHAFYEKVFELLLRLKANYLWPAMWHSAFNEDDPLNPKLADAYGIVMGTSHHEPMLRAQQEWKRHGTGPWDYARNAAVLGEFWREGVRRNRDYESIVTMGMRGDGDMPMEASANTALLERIVADQRKILAEEVNPDVTKIPQLWALYKEVQEYYEKGMRVPDDITLLWCDDNWGNIRRLPTPAERARAGGAGVYYHFDYVGGPRNYKWIDTNPIPKVWEQMNLAWRYGADRIWIVNVGDLKPMEFPLEFFMTFAWDPARWPKERLGEYTRRWAEREFGAAHAAEIAEIVSATLKYNGRRKPELLDPSTYSLENYDEADRVVADFDAAVSRAERISAELPADARDAFFELVLHPAKANAQVTKLYVAVAKNRLYAEQGRASANDWAARARELYQADADLSAYYNHTLAQGKWDHMMDQTHIGYTYWQQPPTNTMPEVREILVPEAAAMGVAADGELTFDSFNRQRRHIDVYNRGRAPFELTANASEPWIAVDVARGRVEKERRLWVTVDWSKAPEGVAEGFVELAGPGSAPVRVKVRALRTAMPAGHGFVEGDGYVSIEAAHYTSKSDAGGAAWEEIPDYGRTLSAMSIFPVTAASVLPPAKSPCLEYRMYLFDPKKVDVEAILGPTLNFVPGRGLRFAVAFDDQPPQTLDALAGDSQAAWETSVKDSVRKVRSAHTLAGTGEHTLKVCMVDPGVVLEKVVVNLGGVRPSYLGPPESYRH